MKRKIYPTLLVLWCILPMFWMSLRASPDGQEAAPIEAPFAFQDPRSEEHTSELQSH